MNDKRWRVLGLVGAFALAFFVGVGCQSAVEVEPAADEPATVTQIAADVLATQAAAVPEDTATPTINAQATARAATRAVDDAEATAHAVSFEATIGHYTAAAVTAIAQETADIAASLTAVRATDDAWHTGLTATAGYETARNEALAAAYDGPIDALVEAAETYKEPDFGPWAGSMVHDMRYVSVSGVPLGSYYNFVAEVTFLNPYSLTEGGWDYGIMFRAYDTNDEFRLVIFSNGQWELRNREGDSGTRRRAGEVPDFDNESGGANSVRLICYEERGAVYINGQFAGELDLSGRDERGRLMLATGLYAGNHIDGRNTDYTGFTVWELP